MMRLAVAGILAGAIWTGFGGMNSAQAQGAPDSENGRFSFHRADEGFLRLDTRSGQVSFCARKPVGWACHPVPDERTALEGEIARLQTDNGLLKKELLARNLPLPGNIKKDPPLAKLPDVELKVPSESDLDRVFSFMDKVWRRLAEKMAAIQRDYFGKI
jgi:hypothetical protein